MVRFLEWLTEKLMKFSKKPWARFVVSGITKDEQIRFEMAWNSAFIKNIQTFGFVAETEEELIQQFLMGSIMWPKDYETQEDDIVTSQQHPNLQDESNLLKR